MTALISTLHFQISADVTAHRPSIHTGDNCEIDGFSEVHRTFFIHSMDCHCLHLLTDYQHFSDCANIPYCFPDDILILPRLIGCLVEHQECEQANLSLDAKYGPVIRKLHSGESLGELALLQRNAKRTATIVSPHPGMVPSVSTLQGLLVKSDLA